MFRVQIINSLKSHVYRVERACLPEFKHGNRISGLHMKMSSSGRQCLSVSSESLSVMAEAVAELEIALNCASKFTADVAKMYPDENCRQIESTKEVMESLCQTDHEVKQFLKALETVQTQYQNSDDVNLLRAFEDTLEEIKTQSNGAHPRLHKKYTEMMELIQDSAVPGPSNLTSGHEVIDEDLIVTQAQASVKCPYTGQEMVNPVKNKHCGHSYDLDGILEFIKNKKKKARCPVSGCINEKPLDEGDLIENKELKRLILQRKNAETLRSGQGRTSTANVQLLISP